MRKTLVGAFKSLSHDHLHIPNIFEKHLLENTPFSDVQADYTLGSELTRGKHGSVLSVRSKRSGEEGREFACKQWCKKSLYHDKSAVAEHLKREVAIMQHLSGVDPPHPNIVRVFSTYEDKSNLHLIMDLCKGGSLLNHMTKTPNNSYSERKAANIFSSVLQAVQFCHSQQVVHGRLSLESFLLEDESEEARIKLGMFNNSHFFNQDATVSLKDKVEVTCYLSPEALGGVSGPESDMWSCGVILYILLTGQRPFLSEDTTNLQAEIREGQLRRSTAWDAISEQAKNLVKSFLNVDPQSRSSAADALKHPWLQPDVVMDQPIAGFIDNLLDFANSNKMKQLAHRVACGFLSGDEISALKEAFRVVDSDKSGMITKDELVGAFQNSDSSNLQEVDVEWVFNKIDQNGSGKIDLNEFLVASMHFSSVMTEERLNNLFEYFDRDNSGSITVDELKQALREVGVKLNKREVSEILHEIGAGDDALINYHEFSALMLGRNLDGI